MYNEALNCESVVENLPSGNCFFFKHFITQGDFIFYSGAEILQIKTTQ